MSEKEQILQPLNKNFKEPKLRFPEFKNEWIKIKLYDITTRLRQKNKDNYLYLPLTISAQEGLISQFDYYDKQIASLNLSTYYIIQKGQFAYNKSYSNGYPYGAIKRLNNYDIGVLSSLYICFQLKRTNSDYICFYFDSNKWNKEVRLISGEGARNHGLLNLSADDFFNISLFIPNIMEQEKISKFLLLLYKKIELMEAKINILKKYKKGLLQIYIKLANQSTKIFKISSVCDLVSGYNFTPNDYCESGMYEVITIGNVLDERYVEGPFKKVNIMPSELILLHEDDLLISMTGNVGRTSFAKSKKQLLNQRVSKFNFYDQNNKDLVYFITKSDKFKRRMIILSQGGAQPNLKNKDILNFKCNILANEQNNIFIKCYKLIDEETILLKEKYEKLHLVKMQLMKDLFI